MEWFTLKSNISVQILKILISNVLKPSDSFTLMNNLIDEIMGDEFFKDKILNLKDLVY